MNQIAAYLEKLRSAILTVLNRIEESPQFERLQLWFDSLDPRYQKRIRAGSIVGALFLFFVFATYPVLSVFITKYQVSGYRQLIAKLQTATNKSNVVYQPAPRPAGWISLPGSTAEDMEASLSQFLGQMGVPQDLMDLKKGNGAFDVKIDQVSIRQIVYIIFQIDGWYPALKFENLKITTNKDQDNTLDMVAHLSFDAAEAQKLQQSATSTSDNLHSAVSPTNNPSDPNGPVSTDNPDFSAPPPPPPPDDFGAELPPPPPFEEDL